MHVPSDHYHLQFHINARPTLLKPYAYWWWCWLSIPYKEATQEFAHFRCNAHLLWCKRNLDASARPRDSSVYCDIGNFLQAISIFDLQEFTDRLTGVGPIGEAQHHPSCICFEEGGG